MSLNKTILAQIIGQVGRPESLALDFLANRYWVCGVEKQFADIITFTRPSASTRINPLGLVESVAANVPCIDHSPVNLATGVGAQTLALAKDRSYAITAVGGTVAVAGAGVNVSQMGAAAGVIQTPAGVGTVDVTFTPGGGVTALHVREVLGLSVWEQRTNECSMSSVFQGGAWFNPNCNPVADGPMSSNGVNFKRLTQTAAVQELSRSQWGAALTSGSIYTISALMKSGSSNGYIGDCGSLLSYVKFDLTNGVVAGARNASGKIFNRGNGEYWCTATWSGSAGSNASIGPWSGGADIYGMPSSNPGDYVNATGFQVEQGSFGTPYIPTNGAQVTRAADVPTINVLSPWFKSTEGTFVIESDYSFVSGTFSTILDFDGSAAKLYVLNGSGGGDKGLAGVGGNNLSGAVVSANVPFKVAVAYSAAGIASSVAGQPALSRGDITAPPSTLINLGRGSFAPLNGHLRKVRYIKTRLSNVQLQALSA